MEDTKMNKILYSNIIFRHILKREDYITKKSSDEKGLVIGDKTKYDLAIENGAKTAYWIIIVVGITFLIYGIRSLI